MVDVEEYLRKTSALLQGHFKLASGRHSARYIEKFRIMEDPAATTALCGMIAARYREAGIEVVVGPAMGGVILAFETARQLGVRDIFTEKDASGRHVIERGFQLRPGERALVVDDVLTTGGSVRQALELVRATGAEVAGVAFLIDRSGGAVDFGVPFFACHTMSIESYDPASCPLCREGLALVET
ncbi:MAG TPA: orotate phosphoribosyltransferase [Dehalococcoidia bacterium]|nr:orotate phosphoribosyltransferase [Dehalococcoidia bacterium]